MDLGQGVSGPEAKKTPTSLEEWKKVRKAKKMSENSGTNMIGRPRYRTMEMNGGSSAPYLARTPCVPLFCTLFNRGGNRRAFRLPGEGRDHLHCTVEPSPGRAGPGRLFRDFFETFGPETASPRSTEPQLSPSLLSEGLVHYHRQQNFTVHKAFWHNYHWGPNDDLPNFYSRRNSLGNFACFVSGEEKL